MNKEQEENEFSSFGKKQFTNANTGEQVNVVYENWDSKLGAGKGVSYANTEIDPESEWEKYIKYFPEFVLLDQMPLEDFGKDQSLIDRFYKKPFLINRINLASFPEETLKKLKKQYL